MQFFNFPGGLSCCSLSGAYVINTSNDVIGYLHESVLYSSDGRPVGRVCGDWLIKQDGTSAYMCGAGNVHGREAG